MTTDKGIFIQNIYYMLSYAFLHLKPQDYEKVFAEPFEKIHDLFAAILEKGIAKQIKQGLYREYVPMQEELAVVRGKLNMQNTFSLKLQNKQKLACEFDDFSEDNLYNQILKVTIECLIRAKDVDLKRKQALKKLLVFFGNVKDIRTDHIQWSRLIYQRNNRNYELLLNICYLLLNGMLQTTEQGKYKLLAFSDEHMEKLFERFILAYYKEHHKELNPSAPQIDWNLSQGADSAMIQFLPKMKTDIVLTKNGKTLVIDAKYYSKSMSENYDKATLRSAHLYQIFAYVKNLDKDSNGNVSGLLLYAKTEEEVFPDGEPVMIGGNSIGAKTLDLNQTFSIIAGQLDIIADYKNWQ